MPATAQETQKEQDSHPARQANHHLRVPKESKLTLKDESAGLTLGHCGLTGAELIQTLIDGGSGPSSGCGVAHHVSQRIWKINKTINKIRIRIHFMVPSTYTSNKYSSVPKTIGSA
jgi:hypothetical protein